jgi:AcrR family transcriptional regulator
VETKANSNDRRQQILREATHLFAERGFRGTSIRRIASACGVTEAALYRHFKSKFRLYQSAIRWKANQHDIAGFLAREGSQGSLEDVLTRVAHHILAFLETDPELLKLMLNNSVETGPGAAVLFHEVRHPYIQFLSQQLEARMATGEVRDVDPTITSRCFVGMVMDCALSVGVWAQVNPHDFVANDVVCNNVPIFARGLATTGKVGMESTKGEA